MNILRKKAWAPWIAGILVGLLQIPALLIIQSPVGVSSSYVATSGCVASTLDSNIAEHAYFEKYLTSPKYAWQASMVFGIVIGAFFSRKLSGAQRQAVSPIWGKVLGITRFRSRSVVAFLGGFIMLFGARWAGGCTSGHGLSGVGQLAVSSIIVTVSFVIGGIITAKFFRKA